MIGRIYKGEINALRERVESNFRWTREEMDALRERMESNFRWTVGLILGMWASTLAILIPILLRVV